MKIPPFEWGMAVTKWVLFSRVGRAGLSIGMVVICSAQSVFYSDINGEIDFIERGRVVGFFPTCEQAINAQDAARQATALANERGEPSLLAVKSAIRNSPGYMSAIR